MLVCEEPMVSDNAGRGPVGMTIGDEPGRRVSRPWSTTMPGLAVPSPGLTLLACQVAAPQTPTLIADRAPQTPLRAPRALHARPRLASHRHGDVHSITVHPVLRTVSPDRIRPEADNGDFVMHFHRADGDNPRASRSPGVKQARSGPVDATASATSRPSLIPPQPVPHHPEHDHAPPA